VRKRHNPHRARKYAQKSAKTTARLVAQQQQQQAQPPKPTTPRVTTRRIPIRRGLPERSAQRMAQRLQDVLEGQTRPTRSADRWADILAPTDEERAARDRMLQSGLTRSIRQRSDRPQGIEMDPMAWWALEMAKEGNDVYLLPYQPTPSINPPRPRTLAAGYDFSTRTLRIRFRNGKVYGYYNVPPRVWEDFQQAASPGRFINRVLNRYPYAHEPELDIPTGMH